MVDRIETIDEAIEDAELEREHMERRLCTALLEADEKIAHQTRRTREYKQLTKDLERECGEEAVKQGISVEDRRKIRDLGDERPQTHPCVFCEGMWHSRDACPHVPTVKERREIIAEKGLCKKCVKEHGETVRCYPATCYYCEALGIETQYRQDHDPSLCYAARTIQPMSRC